MATRKSTTPSTPNVPAHIVGNGVTVEVRDGVCHLSFPLDGDYGATASGKSITVAKAGYSESINVGGVKVQVMGYRKA